MAAGASPVESGTSSHRPARVLDRTWMIQDPYRTTDQHDSDPPYCTQVQDGNFSSDTRARDHLGGIRDRADAAGLLCLGADIYAGGPR